MKLLTALAVAIACTSTSIYAQTERDLDSHEHGSAALNVALDADSLFIELETPWNNIVGFEHAPSTAEQEKLVDDALALLNQPGQLFSFNGADCEVSEAMLESSLGEDHDDEHHDEHDDKHDDDHDDKHDDDHDDQHAEKHDDEHAEKHDDEHAEKHDDDHDDEHAEKHDDEHHDDHEGHGDEEETHSSVLASYSFNCSNIDKLAAIDVELLKIWSGFEDLDVQLIGPGGQAGQELSAEQTQLDITPVQ